jgi:agarase
LGLALVVAAWSSSAAASNRCAADSASRHGRGLSFRATGFFRTKFACGRWWLVTPDGLPFYANGIDHVTASPDDDRTTGRCPYCDAIAVAYPSLDAWTTATVDRLRAWGFNTLGAWSDNDRFAPLMPYTQLLYIANGDDWFSPAFAEQAAASAATAVAPRRDDPNLLGWYLDSELRWGPDWRAQHPLLDDYLALPPGSPGRRIAERYVGNPDRFLRVLAKRYFKVTTKAIRAYDRNHLILGTKMITQLTPAVVLRAARRYLDVLTVDDYTLLPGLDDLIQQTWGPFVPRTPTLGDFYALTHKPIMVAEYSFRAADSGLANSWPPIFPIYATQEERADAYAAYVGQLHQAPWIVGDFWFEYVDEPSGGRFDGEDSNFGVVTTSDVPWQVLVDRMTAVHAASPGHLVP